LEGSDRFLGLIAVRIVLALRVRFTGVCSNREGQFFLVPDARAGVADVGIIEIPAFAVLNWPAARLTD
jgi:hypothetical protein